MATEMVFKCERIYSDDELIGPCPYSEEKIQEVKDERYKDLAEEFLDKVFDVDSKLTREAWEDGVIKTQTYLFSPKEIRKTLGYE